MCEDRSRDLLGLNAPYGARCYLTDTKALANALKIVSLNAPYGARCYLTLLSPRNGSALSALLS